MRAKSIKILLIEDNSGDVLLTKEALSLAKIRNEVVVCNDGEAAIKYLLKTLVEDASMLPEIILLDVNLPKRNGHEVLMHIKNEKGLQQIPVIMLTTSSSAADISKAYEEHVNAYIVKPVEASRFIEVIAGIEEFWLSIVHLPKKAGPK